MKLLAIAETVVRYSVWPLVPEALKRSLRPSIMQLRGDKISPPLPSVGLPDVEDLNSANRDPEIRAIAARYHSIIAGNDEDWSGTLSSPDALDALVAYAYHAAVHSHEAMLKLIQSFDYRFPTPPADSMSDEYRQFWLDQYGRIARRHYRVSNESHEFDSKIEAYYPYNTRNPQIIAAHIIASGAILEAITKPPPGRVLELGVGWGNTALQIGLSGYEVTVLDIEKKYLDIVHRRFRSSGLSVNCIHGEFFDAAKADGLFDVVLFYECFHHCVDHAKLLDVLREKLAPDGVIIFAGEAIERSIPYPWGLNPSGQAVWSIRHHGWMELVFSEPYFIDLLTRTGFAVTKNQQPHSAHSIVYTARKI